MGYVVAGACDGWANPLPMIVSGVGKNVAGKYANCTWLSSEYSCIGSSCYGWGFFRIQANNGQSYCGNSRNDRPLLGMLFEPCA